MVKIKDPDNVGFVVNHKLCSGCGACSLVCKSNCIKVIETECLNEVTINEDLCTKCHLCLSVCTGYELYKNLRNTDWDQKLPSDPGTMRSTFVSCAKDYEIRRQGASGGFVSGLALTLLESKAIAVVSCVKQDPEKPLESVAFAAKTTNDIKSSMGSRYMPVSACLGLKDCLAEEKPFMFVGKPCDISAMGKLRKQLPALGNRDCLTLNIFCHNTPYRRALSDLFKNYGLSKEGVKKIRFRGDGWPGSFVIEYENGEKFILPYREAWGKNLSKLKYVPVRCLLCDDPLGREADISVGDPWGKEFASERDGLSLIILRTELAEETMKEIFSQATLEKQEVTEEDVLRCQFNLLNKNPSVAMWRNMYRITLDSFKFKLFMQEIINSSGIKPKLRYVKWFVLFCKKRWFNF